MPALNCALARGADIQNIVGRDFLPRGTGIVTRRPLVLQLINRPAAPKPNGTDKKEGEKVEDAMAKTRVNENNQDEWGEFLHLPGQKFYDFGKIREEIIRDTEKITGKNAGESCPLPVGVR